MALKLNFKKDTSMIKLKLLITKTLTMKIISLQTLTL
jgi:hypothetical protein